RHVVRRMSAKGQNLSPAIGQGERFYVAPVRAASAYCARCEQDGFATRQRLRNDHRTVVCGHHDSGRTSTGGKPEQTPSEGLTDKETVIVPTRVAEVGHLSKRHDGATFDRDFRDLGGIGEADPLPVGGEERLVRNA